MSDLGVRFIHNITKEYPDMIKVIIYKEPMPYVIKKTRKRDKREVSDLDYHPEVSSLKRTKTLVQDLVLCNDFDLFCTFTFNPQKIDRFNYTKCHYSMTKWLHNQHDKDPKFRYLIIPERHKSGAWHFHALISHFNGTLSDSGHKTSTGRVVYNIKGFRNGFTTAVEIDDKYAVSSYVTKYITKDFIKEFNQRRFFCSRDLIRPKKSTNSSIFRNTLPMFRKLVSESDFTETYLIFPSY